MRSINNDYDSIAESWCSEDVGATASLRYFVNPVRFKYYKRIIENGFTSGFRNRSALDVGCGGGILSEELAKTGILVTGVDPSRESIRIAREHAAAGGLKIDYQEASGEKIPFSDGLFDMVFCCDVLEHVGDVRRVVSEISRVLRPGGYFFFDTINRTIISWIAVIYFMQECRLTSYTQSNVHLWKMFIKPEELRSILADNDIELNGLKGINPKMKGPSILMGMFRASRKIISYKELSERMNFMENDDLACSYMGYGIKRHV